MTPHADFRHVEPRAASHGACGTAPKPSRSGYGVPPRRWPAGPRAPALRRPNCGRPKRDFRPPRAGADRAEQAPGTAHDLGGSRLDHPEPANNGHRDLLRQHSSALHLPRLPEPPTHDLTYTRSARTSTSPRGTGICVIWDCISSSSSSPECRVPSDSDLGLLTGSPRGAPALSSPWPAHITPWPRHGANLRLQALACSTRRAEASPRSSTWCAPKSATCFARSRWIPARPRTGATSRASRALSRPTGGGLRCACCCERFSSRSGG